MKNIKPTALLALGASITLASIAAYYSVFGISRLFASQALAVTIMAAVLEASKLITAAYLEKYWSVIHWTRKTYLLVAMAVLMAITSLGIYGFLVSAYQDTAYKMQTADAQIKLQQTKKDRYTTTMSQIVQQRLSLDQNITQLTKGLSNNTLSHTDRNGNVITTTSAATRRALEKQLDQSSLQRDQLLQKENAVNDSINAIEIRILNLQSNSKLASEIGPLKYVAQLAGRRVDTVVNWFILLFIIVFDPLAIILLVSANKILRSRQQPEIVQDINSIEQPIEGADQQELNEQEKQQSTSKQDAIGSKWWKY